jgi:hypothetical protein
LGRRFFCASDRYKRTCERNVCPKH